MCWSGEDPSVGGAGGPGVGRLLRGRPVNWRGCGSPGDRACPDLEFRARRHQFRTPYHFDKYHDDHHHDDYHHNGPDDYDDYDDYDDHHDHGSGSRSG